MSEGQRFTTEEMKDRLIQSDITNVKEVKKYNKIRIV
jgi:hypothetical protein